MSSRTWVRREVLAGPVLVPVAVVLLGLFALGVATISSVGILLIAIALMCAVFLVALAVITIRLDEEGIRARSLFGFSALEVSREEIESVSLREVRALAEFGGWGLRTSPEHGLGLVLRSGPALCVRQRSGRTLTFAFRHAREAAAELEGRGIPVLTSTV